MNEGLEQIVAPLLEWFDKNARVLPWRDGAEPYRVWVSEIMLQQTRVEAVKPYYNRFLQALPTVKDLAECEEDRLLKLWEGLGYYNRVRNMQIAARTVMEEYHGELPADYQKLCSLKGIGEYTAGAIASIAFHIPVPAVDGNVCRVISRITLNEEDILKQSVKKRITEEVACIMPQDRPGDFNQALMELGATVCLPNGKPDCENCPVNELCIAGKTAATDRIPVRNSKKSRKIEKKTIFVLSDGLCYGIKKRPDQGLLAGLYELPNCPGHLGQEEALEYLKREGFLPVRILPLRTAKHIFSHIEWHMIGYYVLIDETVKNPDYLFVEIRETEEKYSIPSAFEAYADRMQLRLGLERIKEESNESIISGDSQL